MCVDKSKQKMSFQSKPLLSYELEKYWLQFCFSLSTNTFFHYFLNFLLKLEAELLCGQTRFTAGWLSAIAASLFSILWGELPNILSDQKYRRWLAQEYSNKWWTVSVLYRVNSSAVVQQYDWVMKDTECSLKRLPSAAEILPSSMSRRIRPSDITAYLMSVLRGGEQCCSAYTWRNLCPDNRRTQHKWRMCCLLVFAGKSGMEKLLRFTQIWGG